MSHRYTLPLPPISADLKVGWGVGGGGLTHLTKYTYRKQAFESHPYKDNFPQTLW